MDSVKNGGIDYPGAGWSMEELIPLAAKLADRYTSMDSSSVPYETAQMLMEAVIYCIREWEEQGGNLPAAGHGGSVSVWEPAYRQGYERVLEKVRCAKAVYEELIAEFEDYGCRNYKDTIVKGMPAFFVKYDPKFCPQDHILTLDYPAMSMSAKRCGVDRILEYLRGIRMEAAFLRRFPREPVINVLRGILPEYRTLYLDNICTPVLMRAAGCVIAGKSVLGLELDADDYQLIRKKFLGDDRPVVMEKLLRVIGILVSALPEEEFGDGLQYFKGVVEDHAVRIVNAVEAHTLEAVI